MMPSGGPSFNPPAEEDGSFTLEGVGIGDFRVTVRGVPPDDSVVTEDDGRFVFRNVAPNRYRLVVSRQGYVGRPLAITMTSGQPLANTQLPMTPSAAIYGRVYRANGEPFGNIEVQALRVTYPEGRRVLSMAASVQTNDLGEYRLFWLPAGRYYVAAVHPQAQSIGRKMMRGVVAGGASMNLGGGPNNSLFSAAFTGDPALAG
jgi:hypothetical protein